MVVDNSFCLKTISYLKVAKEQRNGILFLVIYNKKQNSL